VTLLLCARSISGLTCDIHDDDNDDDDNSSNNIHPRLLDEGNINLECTVFKCRGSASQLGFLRCFSKSKMQCSKKQTALITVSKLV
jgi:hypothetical protein